MRRPETTLDPRKPTQGGVFGWAAEAVIRAVMLFGGVAMALRLGLPKPAGEARHGLPAASDDTGRGRHAGSPSRDAHRAGHETLDMSAPVMLRYFAVLAVVAVAAVLGMAELRHRAASSQQRSQATLTVQQTSHPKPPGPGLQADPLQEITQFRQAQTASVDQYGWVDPGHTRARVPVDRAMALMVGRELETAP